MSSVPTIHRALAAGFLAVAVVSFFFAGLAAYGVTTYTPHESIGNGLMVVAALLAVLAIAGRREARPASLALVGLMLLQVLLGVFGEDVGALGGLHAVNSLLVLLAAWQALRGVPLRMPAAEL
ncbi:MAG TPA: DUF6220 domain-containing protein [Solirubrobacteraceae bacterium]|nr:DUF6220 domain-containing protein [Solirubrobacteraceae bacterium]